MSKKTKISSGTAGKPDSKVVKVATPLPALQVFCICNVQMAEAMNVDLLFPFLAFMIEDMGYTGEALGYHAGILAASFCGAQFCTSVAWGMISDRYGRKFAIVLGTLGAGLGMLIFGFAKTFPQAVLGRIVGGLLCGNLGVVKSFLTEITDDTNRSSAFYLFSLSWAVGSVFAPLIGGMLCKPAEKFPTVFSDSPKNVFVEYPYLLPCLLTVSVNVIASILCMVFMIETVGMKKKVDSGDSTMNDDITVSTEDSLDPEQGVEMAPFHTHKESVRTSRPAGGENETGSVAMRALSRLQGLKNSVSNGGGNTHTHSGYAKLSSTADSDRVQDESVLEFDTSGYDGPTGGAAVHKVEKLQFPSGHHSPVLGASSALSSPGRVRQRSHSNSTAPHSSSVGSAFTSTNGSGVHSGDIEQNIPSSHPYSSATAGIAATSNDYDQQYMQDEAEDQNQGDAGDSGDKEGEDGEGLDADPGDPGDEEMCCPTLFDRIADIAACLTCSTKTRALHAAPSSGSGGSGGSAGSLDNSRHGLLDATETDSGKQLIDPAAADQSGSHSSHTHSPNSAPQSTLNTSSVLTQRVVVLATLNYGMICASSILMDETLPLFLKLDTKLGGFGFSSAEIGTLLSFGAGGMMVLTMLTMPLTNGVSNKWISKFSLALSIPLELAFPVIALLNNQVFAHIRSNTERLWLLWPVLIIVNTVKNLFTCLAFTSSIIMVNHSVTDEHLGAVNGLGQSLGALARSLGPAVGGLLWSMGTRYNFVYINFIATTVLYLLNYYVSHLVPKSLDHRKKAKVVKLK